MAIYIYHYLNWTDFTSKEAVINVIFGKVRHLQGKIAGQTVAGLIPFDRKMDGKEYYIKNKLMDAARTMSYRSCIKTPGIERP